MSEKDCKCDCNSAPCCAEKDMQLLRRVVLL